MSHTWQDLILDDALDLLIDNRGKNPPYAQQGIACVSGMTVTESGLDFSKSKFVSDQTWVAWMPEPTQQNDVILTSEAPLGRPALVPDGRPLVLAQRVFGLRGRQGVLDSRFLYYSLFTPRVRADIQGRATGTTVLGIRQPALRGVAIPAPSFEVQQDIAEVLGTLDDKIAANTKLAATASALAGYVYDATISGLGSIPMSDALIPVLGGTPARSINEYWGGAGLWASAKDVTGADFAVIVDTQEKVTALATGKTKAKPLPSGSVILTARGTVGAVARLARPSAFNQSCYGFAPDALPPGILYFAILRAAERAKSIAHGSVFDTITTRTFQHLEIPDFAGSALSIEAEIDPLLTTVTQKVFENAKLATARDALLPHLMSGKLQVKEAEKLVEAAV